MNERRRIAPAHREGLIEDLAQLRRIQERRRILRALAGASLVPLFGCGSGGSSSADDGGASSSGASTSSSGGSSTSSSSSSSSASSSGTPASCSEIAPETGGPYPGDNTNGPNALGTSGVVRRDIRSSFGGLTGIAGGVPLTFELQVVNAKGSCVPLAGYAVYAWQCDRDAGYSMYGTLANQNYLRGVQPTDANGVATFQSIFPAAYPGRWPHIHFEVFADLATATAAGSKVTTSQLAFPEDVCNAVYATPGYEASVPAMKMTPLASDGVFRDGVTTQLAAIRGSVAEGIVATLVVGVSA